MLLFVVAATIQLIYVIFFSWKEPAIKKVKDFLPASIIICARNEAENLNRFLPSVLEQDYPPGKFEVIVVNDQSTDDSMTILEKFAAEYAQLRIVNIPVETIKDLPGKKYALQQGIRAARYDRVLLTDADCKPASDQWLKTMAGTPADIVLGYGAYEMSGGILNTFIRWETAHTCMQYASYARRGMTYMGVGRNLSYRKALSEDLENDAAFQEIYRNTPSGDDDLLVGKMARKDNVAFCLDPAAHTISLPQITWLAWWKQKTRHLSTGKYYPPKIKSLLGLYALSHSLYWLPGLFLLIGIIAHCQLPIAHFWILVLFFLRLALYWINAALWYRRLREKKLLLFYPLGDLGWALYNVFLSPYIFWKNRQAWK